MSLCPPQTDLVARALRQAPATTITGPTDPGLPAQPFTLTLVNESSGRIIGLEFQNEILLVLADGAAAAAVPDIVTLLDAESGWVVSLDDVGAGLVLDVIAIPSARSGIQGPGCSWPGRERSGFRSIIRGILTRSGGKAQLDVAGLLAHGALRTTKPICVSPTSAPVTAVVINWRPGQHRPGLRCPGSRRWRRRRCSVAAYGQFGTAANRY
ncbi:hypothetical protein GCM10022381_41920 [Leifsonia kafniensis]|uniref:S-Me-THD-like C-terminal domain-containing protein n=1 Tax=Leifsonia kafniensis TaxID=475957 RepID=A0ABP7L983_9MICO